MPANAPRRDRKILLLVSLGIAAAFLAVLVGVDLALPDGRLHVSFLDVGQGDAALIRTPRGKNILVDAGPSETIAETLDKELPFFDRSLDLIILTHPHKDHLGGFLTILKQYRADAVLLTGVRNDLPEYRWLLDNVKDAVRLIAIADRDYEIESGLTVDVLFPQDSLFGVEVESSRLNASSVVFRLNHGQTHILFAGDVDSFVEDRMLSTGVDVRSTIIKIAHHGSKYSSTKRFIEQVNPQTAIVSSGKNNTFGHPHAQTMQTLRDLNIQAYRTDIFGTVRAECDAKNQCEFGYDRFPKGA